LKFGVWIIADKREVIKLTKTEISKLKKELEKILESERYYNKRYYYMKKSGADYDGRHDRDMYHFYNGKRRGIELALIGGELP